MRKILRCRRVWDVGGCRRIGFLSYERVDCRKRERNLASRNVGKGRVERRREGGREVENRGREETGELEMGV